MEDPEKRTDTLITVFPRYRDQITSTEFQEKFEVSKLLELLQDTLVMRMVMEVN
jgi:hypothetical protein